MPYPPSDSTQSIDELEKQLLATWKNERLFTRVSDATRYGPPFIFFEGPPTANGRPGIHHVFSRTLKDLVCRYHAMLGQGVTRIAGWDTHVLPVEIEVEKSLNISGKRQIEASGIERFNKLCRDSVFKYKTDWESLSDRIGYWLDYEHPYVTYSNAYIETVWWLLKRLYEKTLLYRGHKVLPYCPRCGTALSSHEVAQGYETVQTNSVYVTFPIVSRDGDTPRELVIWTTTPWTLLSNVAVAVHPDIEYGEYALADQSGNVVHYIAAAARAGDVHVHGRPLNQGTRVATYSGRDLVGRKYVRPLDVVPLPGEGQHSVVVAGSFVTVDEGTGLVHMAPAFGADDYASGQQNGLAFVNPVAPDGTFRDIRWPQLEVRPDDRDEDADAGDQRRDRLASARNRRGPVRRMAREQRRLGVVAGPLLGDAAQRLGMRPGPRAPRSDRVLRGSRAALGQSAARRFRSAQAVHRRVHVALPRLRRGGRHDAARERGHRRLVRLGLDAVRAVALPVRASGRLQGAFPGRLHLRGRGPDARLVLLTARDRRHGVRRARLQARDRERARARRARAEDVEEPRQRRRSLAGDRRARRRRGAALSARPKSGLAAEAVR